MVEGKLRAQKTKPSCAKPIDITDDAFEHSDCYTSLDDGASCYGYFVFLVFS